jgi:hypothetical protein
VGTIAQRTPPKTNHGLKHHFEHPRKRMRYETLTRMPGEQDQHGRDDEGSSDAVAGDVGAERIGVETGHDDDGNAVAEREKDKFYCACVEVSAVKWKRCVNVDERRRGVRVNE